MSGFEFRDAYPFLLKVAHDFEPGLQSGVVNDEFAALLRPLQQWQTPRRLPRGAQPELSRLGALSPARQAEELGVALYGLGGLCATESGSDARCCLLQHVLRRRRGVVAAIAVLYAEAALRFGLTVGVVSFSDHPLLRIGDQVRPGGVDRSVLINPANGDSLNRLALRSLHEQLTGHEDFDPAMLVDKQAWWLPLQVLLELRDCSRATGAHAHRLLALDRACELCDAPSLLRERGYAKAELGAYRSALEDLAAYIAGVPDAADLGEVAAEIERLRQRSASDQGRGLN